MSNREEFLQKIAVALGREKAAPGPLAMAGLKRPEMSLANSVPLVEQFSRVFMSQHGEVKFAATDEGAREAVAALVTAEGVREVTLWDDERLNQLGLANHLADLGVLVHRWGHESDPRKQIEVAEDSQLGITWADGISAETGAILLQNHGGHGRLVSLLPRHYVVLFRESEIQPTFADLMSQMHQLTAAGALPAYTNFIAGPSSSADIAMETLLGVHGPGRVTAIIIQA